jgi:hypothetical protein
VPVIDPHSQGVLQEVVRRESRSLLRYVGDSFPWTSTQGGPALARLHEVVRAGNEATADVGAYLARHRVPMPFLGSYPASFTSWNFLSLAYLAPRLVATEEESLRALEADVAALPAGEAKAQAEKLLAVKRRNLEALRGLMVG